MECVLINLLICSLIKLQTLSYLANHFTTHANYFFQCSGAGPNTVCFVLHWILVSLQSSDHNEMLIEVVLHLSNTLFSLHPEIRFLKSCWVYY